MAGVSRIHIVHVVINEHGPIFAELIELLSESLRYLGVEVSVATNDLRNDRPNLLVGATCFLQPGDFVTIRSCPAPVIVFQSEALDQTDGFLRQLPDYWNFLRSAPQLWDYSERNMRFLAAHGVARACYVPIGYSRSLERIAPAPVKDIDVLFVGSGSPRRAWVFLELERRGVKALHAFRAYGPTRDGLIARSRIVLNLHQFAISPLEQLRIAYLLNNRCFVISETADFNPYGEGVVFCPYEQVPERCVEFLAPGREADREQIALRGYERLQAIPMRESIRTALDQLGTVQAVRPAGHQPPPVQSPFFQF
jgi:hypothetical protein